MEFQQQYRSEKQQEQRPQPQFTAYFDLLPAINRQFSETMASNRLAKNSPATVEPLRISTDKGTGNVVGSDGVICTEKAA